MFRREHARKDVIFGQAVRLIVALAFFVLHYAALFIESFLRDRAEHVSHAIGFHPQRHIKRRFWHVLEIVGAIKIGGAVHIGGAHTFERLEVFVVVILAAVEHQVLKQMREAGFAAHFILGANVVPDIDRNNRRFSVFVHDKAQTVIQREFGVVNFYV